MRGESSPALCHNERAELGGRVVCRLSSDAADGQTVRDTNKQPTVRPCASELGTAAGCHSRPTDRPQTIGSTMDQPQAARRAGHRPTAQVIGRRRALLRSAQLLPQVSLATGKATQCRCLSRHRLCRHALHSAVAVSVKPQCFALLSGRQTARLLTSAEASAHVVAADGDASASDTST